MLFALLIATGVYVATIYNSLVRVKDTVTKNCSNIDVLPKQRHDELPNLVEVCKAHLKHEQRTRVADHVAKPVMNPDADVLMKSEEDHPFILSTKSQD